MGQLGYKLAARQDVVLQVMVSSTAMSTPWSNCSTQNSKHIKNLDKAYAQHRVMFKILKYVSNWKKWIKCHSCGSNFYTHLQGWCCGITTAFGASIPCGYNVVSLMFHFWCIFLLMPGEASDDGPSAWIPATHVRDLVESPRCSLWRGLALATMDTWEVNSGWENCLCFSVSATFSNKNTNL